MGLIFWWMPLLWAVIIAGVIAWVILLRRRKAPEQTPSRAIAHSSRLTALPGYRSALRRYRALLALISVAAVLLLVGAIAVASRPASSTSVQSNLDTRDIVLCLDVSGSMIEYDSELVEVFAKLSERFDGERISLVVFNASAVTYFPLTSDYDYVADQLETIAEQFASDDLSYFDGTFFGDGSSLVGDGLASCALRFDTPEADRSRSVILATDNLVVGDPIFSLQQAGELASERGIRVFGLNPGDTSSKEYLDEYATEFEQVVQSTGGGYYALSDPAAIADIVDRIGAEQASSLGGVRRAVEEDRPQVPLALSFGALLVFMAAAWRLRR